MGLMNAKMFKSIAINALRQAQDDERVKSNPPLHRIIQAFANADEETVEFRPITYEQAKTKIENMVVGTEVVFQDKNGGWHSVIFT